MLQSKYRIITMKKLILFFSFLIATTSILAQCGQNRISFFPKGEHITPYPILMISGNQMTQKVINELTYLRPVYLQSNQHKVALSIVEKCEGQADETQILLRPKSKLRIGQEYSLKVEGLEGKEQQLFERKDTKGNSFFISWTVTEKILEGALNWTTPPRLMSVHYDKEEDCQSAAAYALFKVNIPQPYETLVKTEVVDIQTGKTAVYYLQSESNQLIVGKEAFGGAFDFVENHEYKVRFDLLHINGLATGNWTYWTTFQSPYNLQEDYILDLRMHYNVDTTKL